MGKAAKLLFMTFAMGSTCCFFYALKSLPNSVLCSCLKIVYSWEGVTKYLLIVEGGQYRKKDLRAAEYNPKLTNFEGKNVNMR